MNSGRVRVSCARLLLWAKDTDPHLVKSIAGANLLRVSAACAFHTSLCSRPGSWRIDLLYSGNSLHGLEIRGCHPGHICLWLHITVRRIPDLCALARIWRRRTAAELSIGFHNQAGDSAEVLIVGGQQRQSVKLGRQADQQVHGWNSFSLPSQDGLCFPIGHGE